MDMFCVTGALQLITWVLTRGKAAKGSPTTTYINTLLRDTGLKNVRDLESCMYERREVEPHRVSFHPVVF